MTLAATAAQGASAPVEVPPRRVALMGLAIDAVTEEQAIGRILSALREGRGGVVITPNLDQLRQFRADAAVRALYPGASLVLADGMPLIWASRIAHGPNRLPQRVAGSSLIVTLTAAAAEAGAPIFFLGGNSGAADAAAAKLHATHPALIVAGSYCPPMGFDKSVSEIEKIRALLAASPVSAGGICYVGLGFPKQERLIAQLAPHFPRVWFLGIGISFSFVAGEVPRAPRLLQKLGLEWLHRLCHEPRRLFKRYIIHDLPFAARLFAHAVRARFRRESGSGV